MKLCECGCGIVTTIRRGVPQRFCSGHNARVQDLGKFPARLDAITTHGLSHKREYDKYHQAKQRCQNPKCKRYKDYGGRGIEFRFMNFQEFWNELGACPKHKSLDRIDNDGHYETGNVRWATAKEQYASRRPRFRR